MQYPSIKSSASSFSNSLHNSNYDLAARIVVSTALDVLGKNGLEGALKDANSFIKRKNLRSGL